jgi:hypothetical protein
MPIRSLPWRRSSAFAATLGIFSRYRRFVSRCRNQENPLRPLQALREARFAATAKRRPPGFLAIWVYSGRSSPLRVSAFG